MQNLKLTPTTEKIVSENYPYGFRLKTTKTDYLEFSPKHGFRHCSTTINPKTGRTNNPKKSTYYSIMVLGTDENNHCKSITLDFWDNKRKDETIAFLSNEDNFKLFTPQQMQFIYTEFFTYLKVDIQARVTYCGTKFEDLKPLYEKQITIIADGIKNPEKNLFPQISFDWDIIDGLKVEGFQPFKITHYSNGLSTQEIKAV